MMFNKRKSNPKPTEDQSFFVISLVNGEEVSIIQAPLYSNADRVSKTNSDKLYHLDNQVLYGKDGLPDFDALIDFSSTIELKFGVGHYMFINPEHIVSIKGPYLP